MLALLTAAPPGRWPHQWLHGRSCIAVGSAASGRFVPSAFVQLMQMWGISYMGATLPARRVQPDHPGRG